MTSHPPNPARWERDPTGRHEHRYWNGSGWTDHVADAGRMGVDPISKPSTAIDASSSGATGPASTGGAESAGSPHGWYPDPHNSERLRWWNGVAWTDDVAPASSETTLWAGGLNRSRSRQPALFIALFFVFLVGLGLVSSLVDGGKSNDNSKGDRRASGLSPERFCFEMVNDIATHGIVTERLVRVAPAEIRNEVETMVLMAPVDDAARDQYLVSNPDAADDAQILENWLIDHCPGL